MYGRLRERGAQLVAISPQVERQSDFMVGQHGLPLPELSDPDCAVAAQFGLVYTVPEYLRQYYRSILVNIPFINGDESWRLPLPAAYGIGRDKTVGIAPIGGVVRDTAGNLYGTTFLGGTDHYGTVFEIVQPKAATPADDEPGDADSLTD